MKINNFSNNANTLSKEQSEGSVNTQSSRTAHSPVQTPQKTDKITLAQTDLSASAPSTLTYSGHGMLEVYPANLSIAYVVAHEQRHAQHNRLMAFSRGEEVSQSIKYKISLEGGKPIATGGATQATFTHKAKSSPKNPGKNINPPKIDISLETENTSDKNNFKEINTELSSLKSIKKKYETDIKNIKGVGDSTISIASEEKKKDPLNKNQTIADLKHKLSLVTQKIDKLETSNLKERINNESNINNTPEISNKKSSPKKDNISIRNISDIFSESLKFVEEKRPKVTLLNSASSGLRTQNAISALTQKPLHPIEMGVDFNPHFMDIKIDSFEKLHDKLSNLKISINLMSSKDSFNVNSAASSHDDKMTADTTINTQTGTHTVKPTELFLPHKISSDIHSDTFSALSLSGTIKINGFAVTVLTTDSLHDIANKINRGEDINNNGQLDLTEDLNGNNSLDIIELGTGENRVIVFEDIDLDGILDPSEDLNNNERIDGGATNIGVFAEIQNNQLILTSTSSERIVLTDNNDVLSSLGVLTTDVRGNTILKHYVATSQTAIILNQDPQNSKLSVNGMEVERKTNTISDVISDLTLNLKETSNNDISLKITKDVSQPFKLIKNFIKSFNDTISFINQELEFKKTMKGDRTIQRIRTNLIQSTIEEVSTQSENPAINRIDKAGVNLINKEKKNFNELSITHLLKNLKKGLKSIVKPVKGSYSIFSSLKDLGILTQSDDTLKINDSQLKSVLRDNPKGIANLFLNRSNGIITRMENQLNKLLDQDIGAVKTQKNVIQSLISDMAVLQKVRKKQVELDVSRISETESLVQNIRNEE